jgi:carbon monoxide dehydrogenase subunit G
MRLSFAGAPVITAPPSEVWRKLMDPEFVAQSGPGVESVERIDATRFRVISGLGVGMIKLRFALDLELFDIVDGEHLKMRARGHAPGSAVEVVSSLRLEDAGRGRTRLNWSATSDLNGAVASIGGHFLESTARRLTEEFWTDFARRAGSR